MTYIVTSGKKFLDIDAFAGCIAYAELLNASGKDARAVSTATINESVTQTARDLGVDLSSEYMPDDNDRFVIIDVSEPDFLDGIVSLDRVAEIIDHHLGFEDYWKQNGVDIDIELIGAACTQVYERWVRSGLVSKISTQSAKLLSLGILDNTLNFSAGVTTQRDIDAYKHLASIANTPNNWAALYFKECEQAIVNNVVGSLKNDTKEMNLPGYENTIQFGQLVVWGGDAILAEVKAHLETGAHLINLVSISEGKSYILSSDSNIQAFIGRLLGVSFENSIAIADRLWLRKEFMKIALEKYGKVNESA